MRRQAIRQMKELQAAAPAPETAPQEPAQEPAQESAQEPPQEPAQEPAAAPEDPPKPAPGLPGFLSRFLHMENDTALILPLLLLLGREGADDALLLALLYIMG